jgi:hypothetical protein
LIEIKGRHHLFEGSFAAAGADAELIADVDLGQPSPSPVRLK